MRTAAYLLLCSAGVASALPAAAQTDTGTPANADTQQATTNEPQAGDIIVTAQKRVQRLQDVPLAATVVSEQQLRDQKITDVSQLALATPSFTSHPGNGGSLTIRGIGTQSYARSAEGDVAVILDGVALSGGANPQDPASLFDVQRVEVLQGPQSTLFGKNAAAGAINIVTNPPDPNKLEIKAHLDLDSRNGLSAAEVLNIPLSSDAAIRISGHDELPTHIYYNIFNKHWNDGYNAGVRGRLLYQPNDRLSINLIADYNKTHGTDYGWAIIDAAPDTFLGQVLAACGVAANRDNHKSCLDAPSFVTFGDYGGSAQIDYRLSGGATLTSITAGRVSKTGNNFDTDSVPINNIFNLNDAETQQKSFSEELRLTSPSDVRLEYVAGLYYLHTHLNALGDQAGSFNSPQLYPYGLTLGNSFLLHSKADSIAFFGQSTFHATDKLALIAGIRLTHDKVSADNDKFVTPGSVGPFADISPIAASTHQFDVSGKLGLQYNVNHDWMFYATASKGYKGPAINDQAPDPTVPLVVKPEYVYNFEVGTKASLIDDRLQFAATAYYEHIHDYQVQILDTSSARSYFGNAKSLNVRGVDVSLFGNATRHLFFSAGANFNDGTFGHGTIFGCGPTQTVGQEGCTLVQHGASTALVADASGKRFLGSPKWKLVGRARYHRSVGFAEGFIEGDAVYSSAVTYTAVYDPGDSYKANWMLGGSIGLEGANQRWKIAVFARNLLDERIPTAVFDTPAAQYLGALGSHAQYLGPDSFRRVGVSLDFDF